MGPPVQRHPLGRLPRGAADVSPQQAVRPDRDGGREEARLIPAASPAVVPRPGLAAWAARGLDALAAPRATATLLLLAAALSLACCLLLFDADILDGTAPFWRDPRGVIDGTWADMATALSGYDFFVRDQWRLPLFHVARLGAPDGSSILYTDSTPVLALAGRLLFRLTGRAPNPFGVWTALCLGANAAAMTLLAARLGARSLAAALAATAFGLCAPALLSRWGHTTLMAQFEVTLALAFYAGAAPAFDAPASPARASPALPRLLGAVPLCTLAVWTHAYLAAMVAPIVAAAIAQALLDRRLRPSHGLALVAVLAALLAGQLALSGYVSGAGALSAPGFGLASANLLSPVFPDGDLIATLLGLPRLDATGAQYEGDCYLGAGALLLLFTARRTLAAWARGALSRHPCLAAALLACTLFALSNDVFLGGLHVLHVPLPQAALSLAGVFRSSGRFAWPAMYLAMALGIAGCAAPGQARRRARRGTAILLAAALLQGADAAPLWAGIERTLHAPPDLPVDAAAWDQAIARHPFVSVAPTTGCLHQAPPALGRILMHVQLAAGRLDVATNSLYSARPKDDCAAIPEPRGLSLRWLGDPAQPRPGPGSPCTTAFDLAVCSTTLDAAGRAALLPRAPLR